MLTDLGCAVKPVVVYLQAILLQNGRFLFVGRRLIGGQYSCAAGLIARHGSAGAAESRAGSDQADRRDRGDRFLWEGRRDNFIGAWGAGRWRLSSPKHICAFFL